MFYSQVSSTTHTENTLYVPSTYSLASDTAYESLYAPTGLIFTIQIHSTWGDLYYVGLNGLQVFGENGEAIKLERESNISIALHGMEKSHLCLRIFFFIRYICSS